MMPNTECICSVDYFLELGTPSRIRSDFLLPRTNKQNIQSPNTSANNKNRLTCQIAGQTIPPTLHCIPLRSTSCKTVTNQSSNAQLPAWVIMRKHSILYIVHANHYTS